MAQQTTNILFMNMMSSHNLREENFIVPDIYDLDHKICLIQDIKHTLKKIRNNFNSSRPEFKSIPGRYIVKNAISILWTHWEETFKLSNNDGLPMHKSLHVVKYKRTSRNFFRRWSDNLVIGLVSWKISTRIAVFSRTSIVEVNFAGFSIVLW
jgi:hypothetical protein